MGFGCFGGVPTRPKAPRRLTAAGHQKTFGDVAAGPSRSQVLPVGCKYFTYRELEEATGDWAQNNVIGDGGFGRVYKGKLRNGLLIAAKRLDRHGLQGDKEFNVEVSILSRLHHPGIIKLLGVCVDGDQRIAVFELLSRGSLSGALALGRSSSSSSSDGIAAHVKGAGPSAKQAEQTLTWQQRVQVALGLAQGLAYLHQERLVHRDVTSGNVLLTEGAHARIADFGLAQQLVTVDSMIIAAPVEAESILMGTYGYVAPEYATAGELSQKTDVYAFGVVLLEVLTAKPAVDGSRPPGCQLLSEWLLPSLSSVDKIWDHLDPVLDVSTVAAPQLATLADVALACLSAKPANRPRMKDVVRVIEQAAAFIPDAPPADPTATSSLMDAAVDPMVRSSFQDPFASNPFTTSIMQAPELHTPLSTGMPGASDRRSPSHVSGSSAASTTTPLRCFHDPFGAAASPTRALSRLSSSRAAHSLPKAQPEDFTSPLQSGLRFGVMSQVSPDVGSAFGRSSSTDEAGGRKSSYAAELSSGGSSPLFEALASRQSSPVGPSDAAQRSQQPSQSPDANARPSRSANRSLDYPEIDTDWRLTQRASPAQHRIELQSSAAAEQPSSSIDSSNPFLSNADIGTSFAAAVRQKEWRLAGPPSAPAYAEEPSRGNAAGGGAAAGVPRQRGGGRGPGGPLADSVASLTVSMDRPPGSRQAASAAPGEIFGVIEEGVEAPPSGQGAGRARSAERPPLSPSIGRRRSSGNPFKHDEECSTHVRTSTGTSGNPFAVSLGEELPVQTPGAQLGSGRPSAEMHWPCAQLGPAVPPRSPRALAA